MAAEPTPGAGKVFRSGAHVVVGERYQGAGRYSADEYTGLTFVVLRGIGGGDYKLGHPLAPDDGWVVIMHTDRLSEASDA
jgi:hypothetical protein